MKNVLFVASNATAIHFDFAKELDRIQGARELAGGSFTLIARWSVSAHDLRRLIQEHRPDVVHVLSGGVNPANHGLMLDRGGGVEHFASRSCQNLRSRTKKASVARCFEFVPLAEAR